MQQIGARSKAEIHEKKYLLFGPCSGKIKIITWREARIAMFSREITVTNQVGLYARPATFFIQKANEFRSTIMVEKEERKVNAKSLLGVLSLGITKGSLVRISAEGPDEQEAVDALCDLVDANFGE
jgi:phosphocarrier protein